MSGFKQLGLVLLIVGFGSSALAMQGGQAIPKNPGSPSQFSDSVFLKMQTKVCTASRISRFFYLTAKHCNSPTFSNVTIVASNGDLFEGFFITGRDLESVGVPLPAYTQEYLDKSADVTILRIETNKEADQIALDKVVTIGHLDFSAPSSGAHVRIVGGGCLQAEVQNGQLVCTSYPVLGDNMKFMESEVQGASTQFMDGLLYFRTLSIPLMSLLPGDSGGPVYSDSGSIIAVNSQVVLTPDGAFRTQYHARLPSWITDEISDNNGLNYTIWERQNSNPGVKVGEMSFHTAEMTRGWIDILSPTCETHTQCTATYDRGRSASAGPDEFRQTIKLTETCHSQHNISCSELPAGWTSPDPSQFPEGTRTYDIPYEWDLVNKRIRLPSMPYDWYAAN